MEEVVFDSTDADVLNLIAGRAIAALRAFGQRDCEDLKQEIILALLSKATRIEVAEKPMSYAFIVARNAAIDWLRKENRYHERMISEVELNGTVDGESVAQKSEGGSAAAPLTDVEKVRMKLVEVV